MTIPISQPVTPAQPEREYYGLQELALFRSYTRETYRAAFGVEAPPFDPSRVAKAWFDSTADISRPENVAIYKMPSRDSSGNWVVRQLVIPAGEAATVNLPGALKYPTYVIAPTSASRVGPGHVLDPAPVNPNYLSLASQAQQISTEIGGTGMVEETLANYAIEYPHDEPRRLWDVVFKGYGVNVGLLLVNRNAKGVGAPGHWNLTGQEPVWVADPPAPTGLDDTRSPREMPIRDLLPNENFQVGLMGVGVIRTDKAADRAKASGQFTAEDRATLQAIYQAVRQLAR